jgi:NMD protein affecting ribosome stability and mRNA decay
MSTKVRGRGNVHTRRNLAEFDANDPYAPRVNPGETAICTECHALYERRHWFFDEEAYFYASMQPETRKVLCPACQKIRDRYAEGRVTLRSGAVLTAHKDDILRLIHNEEARAKGVNPLERIMEITETDDGVVITTTNEKLAQRIGRTLKNTYHGQTTYRWSEPKMLTVEWQRTE